jgi:3-oxoacyl-[acyl-carrier protein] reductase
MGKVAVVTGAGHGIGKQIADELSELGHTVHRVDLPDVDLSDSSAVNTFFAEIGSVDILVNNAGGVVGQIHHPLEEITDEMWAAIFGANIMSTFHCTRAVVPGMKEKKWGRIVTISSGAGRSVSLTGIQAYATAKAAQIAFTRQMAFELGQHGVTVNCIAPGFILSNPSTQKQWESYGADGQKKIIDAIATRRLGQPSDIANAVKFFAAESSSWVTGQCLSVDGGHSLF